MIDLTPGATLALGFVLGAGHALEPDHVAAIGTLVSEQRRLTMSCLLGACWGLGHTAALLAAGVAVLVFRVAMPAGMERGLDMSVALLSIGLGVRALWRLAAGVSLHRHTTRTAAAAPTRTTISTCGIFPPCGTCRTCTTGATRTTASSTYTSRRWAAGRSSWACSTGSREARR